MEVCASQRPTFLWLPWASFRCDSSASVRPYSLDLLCTRGFRFIHIDLMLVQNLHLFLKRIFLPLPLFFLLLLWTQRHPILKVPNHIFFQSPKKPRQHFPDKHLLQNPLGVRWGDL